MIQDDILPRVCPAALEGDPGEMSLLDRLITANKLRPSLYSRLLDLKEQGFDVTDRSCWSSGVSGEQAAFDGTHTAFYGPNRSGDE